MNKQTNTAPMYTCKGKGGTYELIGRASAAGQLHDVLASNDYPVYRDTESGLLFVRVGPDFDERMEAIPSPVDQDAKAEQGESELPPLPKPLKTTERGTPLYFVGQMLDYARVALAARSPVAAPDAEAIRSAAPKRTPENTMVDMTEAELAIHEQAIRSAAREEAAKECERLYRYCMGGAGCLFAAKEIRALSQPSPAVKSAEPDYRDLYEKCKREKAAAYERLTKYEDVKMVKSAEPTGGVA